MLLGWDTVLPNNQNRVVRVPGTHESMVKVPHVQVLGSELSDAIIDSGRWFVEHVPESYSPLQILQVGSRQIAPLFCVAGAGSSITSFVDLVTQMGELRPMHGFQPRGLDN